MKHYDYYWQRTITTITGIIFITQLLSELVVNRKPGYEWVLPLTGTLFALALIWSIFSVIINAIKKNQRKKQIMNQESNKEAKIEFTTTQDIPEAIMRISEKGVWVNPNMDVNDAAKAVIATLDEHIKRIVNGKLDEVAAKVEKDFKAAFGADTCASWTSWIRQQKSESISASSEQDKD